MKARDVSCTVCNRPDCEPAAHAAWTEFDAERGIWIERTSEEFFRDSITELEATANARLIGAAPDLLAACKEASLFFEQNDDFTDSGRHPIPGFILDIRIAIAKATEEAGA